MFSNARKIGEQRAKDLIAGHCTLIVWWALRHAGVLERMVTLLAEGEPGLEPLVHATRTNMSAEVLLALLQYLEQAGLVEFTITKPKAAVAALAGTDGMTTARLTAEGRALLEHGDAVLEMVRAYEGVLEVSEHLLAKLRAHGSGGPAVRKSEQWLAAQAQRFQEEVYPAVRELIAGHKVSHLLDISCGTGDLLINVAQKIKQVVAVGIGSDAAAVRRANAAITQSDLEKRLIAVTAQPREVCVETQRTFDRIGVSRQLWNGIDCIIASQVLSELAAANGGGGGGGGGGGSAPGEPESAMGRLLAGARKHFSKARLMVIEPVASPRFEKNFYAAEMGLMLKLMNAAPPDPEMWRAALAAAKWKVIEEKPLVTDGLMIFMCTAV